MEAEQKENLKYPSDPNCYRILEEIGRAENVIVYKAICTPLNASVVAIKAIDFDHSRSDFDNIIKEAKPMCPLSHPNILNPHCSFAFDHYLWMVMPFLSAGSIQSIIASAFPHGLSEPCIAIVLKQTLSALYYLHDQGRVHGDVKAGNILLDSDGSVKLADFGISASVYEVNTSSSISSGAPYWRAPEVGHSRRGYSLKADIWSFGVTALELAHGRPPLSHFPPLKSLIMKNSALFDCLKSLNSKNREFSKSFKEIVGLCLVQDPSKRPSVGELLNHSFFKNCGGSRFLVKNVLHGLVTVENRLNRTRPLHLNYLKDNEKHRRIVRWKFNIEGFVLEPVFETEKEEDYSIMQPVSLDCQTINPEASGRSPDSLCEHSQRTAQRSDGSDDDIERDGGCEDSSAATDDIAEDPVSVRASLLQKLLRLKKNLEAQMEAVMEMIREIDAEAVEMSKEEQLQ